MKKLFSLLLVLLFVPFVLGASYFPPGDLDGRNIRSFYNFTSLCFGTSCIQNWSNVTGSGSTFVYAQYFNQFLNTSNNVVFGEVNATTLRGNLNASYVLNSPWALLSELNGVSVALQTNISNVDARVTSLNNSKLNVTDQRYNDTSLINSINASIQVNLSNFVTKGSSNQVLSSWVNLSGYPSACPSGSYLTQLDDSVTCTSPTGDEYIYLSGYSVLFNQTKNNLTILSVASVFNESSVIDSKVNKSGDVMTGNLTVPNIKFTTFTSSPSLYADADTNSGIQFVAPDVWYLVTGGVPWIQLTSLGVGVNGHTDATHGFHVNTSSHLTSSLLVEGVFNSTASIGYIGNSSICTEDNGLCVSGGSGDGGGWTNTSTYTQTTLNVNITIGNLSVGSNPNWFIGKNDTHSLLTSTLPISINQSVFIGGSQVCTEDNGLCVSGGSGGNASINGGVGYIAQFQNGTLLNNSVIYQSGSNVGINTSTPSQILTVNGNVNVTGCTYYNGGSICGNGTGVVIS